jgi:hypothetical protein
MGKRIAEGGGQRWEIGYQISECGKDLNGEREG